MIYTNSDGGAIETRKFHAPIGGFA